MSEEKKTRKEWEEGLFDDDYYIGHGEREIGGPKEKPEKDADWRDKEDINPKKDK